MMTSFLLGTLFGGETYHTFIETTELSLLINYLCKTKILIDQRFKVAYY